MEPDALVQCPYDRSHQVRVSRLPYHLVRCQQTPPQCPPRAGASPSCPHPVPMVYPWCPHGVSVLSPWCPHGVPVLSPSCPRAELSELELEEPPPFILRVTKGDLPVPCY
ncbi:GTSF1 factor, partial [Paradoxornis webbianus]|nr:GTSF1 factor [Sinosuthora webbiana]